MTLRLLLQQPAQCKLLPPLLPSRIQPALGYLLPPPPRLQELQPIRLGIEHMLMDMTVGL
jgi:hypothetical protein